MPLQCDRGDFLKPLVPVLSEVTGTDFRDSLAADRMQSEVVQDYSLILTGVYWLILIFL